jgi:hypothetical protein
MNDNRTADTLRQALHERGEGISPTPALPGILHRANSGGSRTSAPWRRWLTVAVAGLATAGLVTAAVLAFGPGSSSDAPPVAGGDETTQQLDEPAGDPAGEPVTSEPGLEVPLALFYANTYQGGGLSSGEFVHTSSGDVGVDAVQALMQPRDVEPFTNMWQFTDAEIASVLQGDGVLVADFSSPVRLVCNMDVCPELRGEAALQQLVWTLDSALRTDDPVLITVDGEPATEVFGTPVDGPVAADPAMRSNADWIRPESPAQRATVTGPVTVTGESAVFEGSFVWEVWSDGEIVEEGFTSGGGIGAPMEFEFTVDLPPGDYTIGMYVANMAGSAEGLSLKLAPTYLDVTVE